MRAPCGSRSFPTSTATAPRSRRCWRTSSGRGVDATIALGDRRQRADRSARRGRAPDRSATFPTVRGNHDRWMVEGREARTGRSTSGARRASRHGSIATGSRRCRRRRCSTARSSSATARPQTTPSFWMDELTDDARGDRCRASMIEARGGGDRLSGAALRPHARAAHGAARGRAADRQSGQRRPAVPPRLARCALCGDRAARGRLVGRARSRSPTTTQRRWSRRSASASPASRKALETGWADARRALSSASHRTVTRRRAVVARVGRRSCVKIGADQLGTDSAQLTPC